MSLAVVRVDDRLIHGQVVVGWGQPLGLGFIALVDDKVRSSGWEQDLYRMGVPPGIEAIFASVDEAARRYEDWVKDARIGLVLTGDIDTLIALSDKVPKLRRVTLGGIHHKPGRSERLRYVYLTADEVAQLRELTKRGIEVVAQDVPTARAVPLAEFAK
ncbi:MAG TPA: PTS sugar transporter subunit IIB [Gemmatimonadales bacterium]|nr:PTS sugar transporter subunit IIB [Gemmatimonadales bacterium]